MLDLLFASNHNRPLLTYIYYSKVVVVQNGEADLVVQGRLCRLCRQGCSQGGWSVAACEAEGKSGLGRGWPASQPEYGGERHSAAHMIT